MDGTSAHVEIDTNPSASRFIDAMKSLTAKAGEVVIENLPSKRTVAIGLVAAAIWIASNVGEVRGAGPTPTPALPEKKPTSTLVVPKLTETKFVSPTKVVVPTKIVPTQTPVTPPESGPGPEPDPLDTLKNPKFLGSVGAFFGAVLVGGGFAFKWLENKFKGNGAKKEPPTKDLRADRKKENKDDYSDHTKY